VPRNTKKVRHSSCFTVANRNTCVEDMEGDWIWFVDDDHSFEPLTLMKLLGHMYGPASEQVVVATGLYSSKTSPSWPILWHGPYIGRQNYSWEELAPGTFILPQGDLAGTSGMLIRKRVLDDLGGYPWFKCGQLDRGEVSEDFFFCYEVQKLGFEILVDRDIMLPHLGICKFTARRDPDGVYRPEIEPTTGERSDAVTPLEEAIRQNPRVFELLRQQEDPAGTAKLLGHILQYARALKTSGGRPVAVPSCINRDAYEEHVAHMTPEEFDALSAEEFGKIVRQVSNDKKGLKVKLVDWTEERDTEEHNGLG